MSTRTAVMVKNKRAANGVRPNYAFSLNQDEVKKFDDWKKEHDKTCRYAKPGSCGAIGGRFNYCFAPTSLGCVARVQCACGAEIDLTDYLRW